MREPLLRSNPDFDEVTLQTLVGVANAVEHESVARYAWLARRMRERGEITTAEALETMRQEEMAHVDAVANWAASLGAPLPPVAEFNWRLPEELSSSWDDVAGSALLTPYKAFAIAALNEQRAFALYSYLSAQASEPAVAAQAERLALEELRHAALMRRWRRKAWHDERRDITTAAQSITTEAQLQAMCARHEGAIEERLGDVAARLSAAGDHQAAGMLLTMQGLRVSAHANAPASGAKTLPAEPLPLLNAAQEPLEIYSAALENVLAQSEGTLFAAAEAAHVDAVRRLAHIGHLIESRRHT